MGTADGAAQWTAEIYNAAWHVRNVRTALPDRRRQAIQRMGVTVAAAFNTCDDYEPMLRAVAEGLTVAHGSTLAL